MTSQLVPNLILIGAQGSGKGTQTHKLIRSHGYLAIATGQILRDHVKQGDALGRSVQKYLKKGELVPDNVVEDLVVAELKTIPLAQSIVFDGFPRTLAQAEFLDRLFAHDRRRLPHALYLEVPRQAVIARLAHRYQCENCGTLASLAAHSLKTAICPRCQGIGQWFRRTDDNPELIEERLNRFYGVTLPLVAYYEKHGRLTRIQADKAVEQVSGTIDTVVNRIQQGK